MPATKHRPDRRTRAVAHILADATFVGHEDRFAAFSREHDSGCWWDFERILADWNWSPGQMIALRAAESINDGTDLPGSDALLHLDERLRLRVLQALRVHCGFDDEAVA